MHKLEKGLLRMSVITILPFKVTIYTVNFVAAVCH